MGADRAIHVVAKDDEIDSLVVVKVLSSIIAAEKPDVVITDLVMPGRTGPELLKGIRHYCGSVPVLVYTGHPESDLLASTLKSPPVFFLRKPCDPARLLRTVRNAIKVAGHVFGN